MEPIHAVNVVIINKEAKLLIAKRAADKPMPNKWEFPGGKVEPGENLEACGIREIKEELDLDIIIDTYLGAEDIKYKDKDFCLHLFTAYLESETSTFKLHEHSQAVWVEYKDLKDYDLPIYELSLMQGLKKIMQEE